jgi:GNAT superfamily N-acetyltransferase
MDKSVIIVPYETSLKEYFKAINSEWIEDMFVIEETDRRVLEDPEGQIINGGGHVLFAKTSALGVVGTCALQQTAPLEFELIKMGVLKKARGLNVGRILLEAAIEKAKQVGAKKLYLMTNKKCEAAIHLYLKYGFNHSEALLRAEGSKYNRCDVAMIYPL